MAELTAPKKTGEGGHWYTRTGEAAYEQPTADGKGTRATNLKDARKLGLLPSVTTVLSALDRPQLTLWKLKNAVRTAGGTARRDGEEEEEWVQRVLDAAEAPASEAADLGSRIHDALALAVGGEEGDAGLGGYIAPALGWLVAKLAEGWTVAAKEEVLVGDGYAGRVDLVLLRAGRALVVDWKSRKTRPEETDKSAFAPYPTQEMQLAAYAMAFRLMHAEVTAVETANVILSSTEPGRWAVRPHGDVGGAWEAFQATLALWAWVKGYDPRGQED